MKLLLTTLCLVSSLFFISGCKKDSTNPNSPFVGKWYLKKVTVTTTSNNNTKEETTSTDFDSDSYISFATDGTGIDASETYPDPFYFTVTDSGKKINLTYASSNDYTTIFDVMNLTSSQLTISTTFSGTTYQTTRVMYYSK